MHKGPTGPQSGRTPRSRAEEIGADPAGFKEGPPYDVAGGHPITKAQPEQRYEDAASAALPTAGAKSAGISAPFTIASK